MDKLKSIEESDSRFRTDMEDLVVKSYGGAWRFNEIIGYIRLHFLGTQVRGEYYSVRRKRIRKTRRKQFEYLTCKLAPEREFIDSSSSDAIYSTVLGYIDDCRKELEGRHVDSSGLETIGPHVNWMALYDSR